MNNEILKILYPTLEIVSGGFFISFAILFMLCWQCAYIERHKNAKIRAICWVITFSILGLFLLMDGIFRLT